MIARWEVRSIDEWTDAGVEREGRHRHNWWRHPDFERTWLFKPARVERDRSFREDVIEKLASEIAHLLGVPAAPVEMATRGGHPGALVEDVRMRSGARVPGRVLLAEVVDDYAPTGDNDHRGHNVRDIRRALARFAQPPDSDLPQSFGGFDVFAGYLVFDALIAHGDRHEGNWAVLVPPPDDSGPERLCASYDHAASLGFTLTDRERSRRLDNAEVAAWALRGRARRFEHQTGQPWASLVELAASAVSLCGDAVRQHWRDRVSSMDAAVAEDLVAAAPLLSDVCRSFVLELLMTNRRRLLDVLV